jgi:hypothetical protein
MDSSNVVQQGRKASEPSVLAQQASDAVMKCKKHVYATN